MGFQFVLALFLFLVIKENGCQAGKAFGGFGNIGAIKQLNFQLITAQQEITFAKDSANATIQSNIATTQAAIDEELKVSENRVSGSTNGQCVNQYKASVSQVNSEGVKKCDSEAQFQAIELKVKLLGNLHGQIWQGFVMCRSPTASPTCIQDFSETITTQITEQKDSIIQDIGNAVSDAAKCAEDAAKEAHDIIAQAEKAFNECVKSSV